MSPLSHVWYQALLNTGGAGKSFNTNLKVQAKGVTKNFRQYMIATWQPGNLHCVDVKDSNNQSSGCEFVYTQPGNSYKSTPLIISAPQVSLHCICSQYVSFFAKLQPDHSHGRLRLHSRSCQQNSSTMLFPLYLLHLHLFNYYGP